MYSETTRSITVTVKPFYLEDQSSPAENRYVWAYHVRIENRGETVQLRRRHWKIPTTADIWRKWARPGRRWRAAGARSRRASNTSGTLPTPSGIMVGS
jgi:ApaG protein